jgi:hypothetical protein
LPEPPIMIAAALHWRQNLMSSLGPWITGAYNTTTNSVPVNLRPGEVVAEQITFGPGGGFTVLAGGFSYPGMHTSNSSTLYSNDIVHEGESLPSVLMRMHDDGCYMAGDIKELRKEIKELKAENGKLMGMIEKMWYAPNMPGAPEAPDHPSFKK